MKKFIVGKTYAWADSRFDPFHILSRTDKTVTVSNNNCTWRMKIRHDHDGVEWVRDSANHTKKYQDAFTSLATYVEPFDVRIDGNHHHVKTDSWTGTLYISRISPYDLTRYHWARAKDKDDNVWDIHHPTKPDVHTVYVPSDVTDPYEYVIRAMINYDTAAGFKPRIDHT